MYDEAKCVKYCLGMLPVSLLIPAIHKGYVANLFRLVRTELIWNCFGGMWKGSFSVAHIGEMVCPSGEDGMGMPFFRKPIR